MGQEKKEQNLEKRLKEVEKQISELSKIHPLDEDFVKRQIDKLLDEKAKLKKILFM